MGMFVRFHFFSSLLSSLFLALALSALSFLNSLRIYFLFIYLSVCKGKGCITCGRPHNHALLGFIYSLMLSALQAADNSSDKFRVIHSSFHCWVHGEQPEHISYPNCPVCLSFLPFLLLCLPRSSLSTQPSIYRAMTCICFYLSDCHKYALPLIKFVLFFFFLAYPISSFPRLFFNGIGLFKQHFL